MSASTTQERGFIPACSASTKSLKRSGPYDADDSADADLRRRKRGSAAASSRQSAVPGLDQTSDSQGDSMDLVQANGKDEEEDDNDTDVSMPDCGIRDKVPKAIFKTEESARTQREICFGTIADAKVALLNENQSNDSYATILSINPGAIQRFAVSSRQECHYLQDNDGEDFAVVNSRTATALQRLQGLPPTRLEAVLIGGDPNRPDRKGKRTVFCVSIDIYGLEEMATEIDKDIPYKNPHFYGLLGARRVEDTYIPSSSRREDQQAPVIDIAKIFVEVEYTRKLPTQNADCNVRTPLLEHQKEALWFITQRESMIVDDDLSLWKARETESESLYYQHVILKSRISKKPESPSGGILADDMGLGKTLSMLTAIVMSLDESRAFMYSQDRVNIDSAVPYSRRASSTLVIAPSAVLLDGWQDEIKRHVSPELLRVYKYHGSRKDIDLESLVNYDIILTTYATLASDFMKGTSPLQQATWFRVVLDEAHAVRHQSTQQFRAAYSLHAERRWCITGTPIQNRLEDLGSLIRFLRVVPFDSNSMFRKYISEPLLTDAQAGDRSLRLLLRSICLRRTRNLLDIPKAKDQAFVLSLSTEERDFYSQIIEDTARKIDDCISSRSIAKAYSGIFEAIMRLRLVCNHGTQQIPESRSETEGCCADDGVDGGIITCSFCSCEINVSNGQTDVPPGASLQNSIQLLCPVCLSLNDNDKTRNQKKLKNKRSTKSRPMHNIATGDDSPRPHSRNSVSSASSRPSLSLNGHSSKLSALIQNIQGHMQGNKTIVFSCWKTTLNLIGLVLENAGIHYVRIDGATPTLERNKIVKQFQEDPDTKLLLMTTGTGAVGLNLTAATRIYLLEPQWNPAIEAQAIGRAVRLGQTRTVTVIRYVMEKTIEESIQSRQIMKLQLAELTLEKKDGNEQTVLQRLKDLRSLLHRY